MDIKAQIAEEAEKHVEEYFNGGVSPATEQHCTKAFISGAEWLHTEIVQPLQSQLSLSEQRVKELSKRIEDLEFSAKGLLHLHSCEQEGLLSGKPKPEDWITAVNELSEVVHNL